MKIKRIFVIVILILISIVIFLLYSSEEAKGFYYDDIILSLPKRSGYDCYMSDSDYSTKNDYCIYYYKNDITNELPNIFIRVDSSNSYKIKRYLNDFVSNLESREIKNNLDLNSSFINDGDYFYLVNRKFINSTFYDEFAYYNLYYFDKENLKFYFIHNND